ncbi:MAG: hypothetical protein JWM36_4334 [Hyphomicrobiales bacterium]|nr:hypothetical protein [Hyphomicrobiales bacterium]
MNQQNAAYDIPNDLTLHRNGFDSAPIGEDGQDAELRLLRSSAQEGLTGHKFVCINRAERHCKLSGLEGMGAPHQRSLGRHQ